MGTFFSMVSPRKQPPPSTAHTAKSEEEIGGYGQGLDVPSDLYYNQDVKPSIKEPRQAADTTAAGGATFEFGGTHGGESVASDSAMDQYAHEQALMTIVDERIMSMNQGLRRNVDANTAMMQGIDGKVTEMVHHLSILTQAASNKYTDGPSTIHIDASSFQQIHVTTE